jgi:glycosyltransferase involved in cell wall biosynthesis
MNKDENIPFVSVVIPMYNEEYYIQECLFSLIGQNYPKDKYEIIVVDGNSEDHSSRKVNEIAQKNSLIKIFNNSKRITPVSFNIGIDKAKGEIIIFVGAHAICEKDYISQCVGLLNNTNASNVGGIQNTVGTDYISHGISFAMLSPFGVGNAYFHFSKKERYVDSIWGGAFRKETLIKLGGFNETYIKNQDYELNYRLRKMGGKIFLSPKIKCKYFVRNSIKKLASQYFKYGFWKAKTINEHPDSMVLRQMIPPVFVISLIISIILLLLNLSIGFFIPMLYFLINLLFSVQISFTKGLKYILILPIIFFAIHVSWGIGFIFGLKKFGLPRLGL